METYLFEGKVLPERARLDFQLSIKFKHFASGTTLKADISVLVNQVAVWIDTESECDIYDLRNIVKNILQNELAVIGYLEGYAYELEITRVLNRNLDVDRVFGIDIPCIADMNRVIDKQERIQNIRQKCIGADGVYLHRCFVDLTMAMRSAENTGFYCYRAIESLREHCASKHQFATKSRDKQWKKFRAMAQCEEATIREIKSAADPVRHGGVFVLTGQDRESLFIKTWGIVDKYIESL